MAVNKVLLGKILATIVTGAIDGGQIAVNPIGILTDPQNIAQIVEGFLQIWLKHPASGVDVPPMAPATPVPK